MTTSVNYQNPFSKEALQLNSQELTGWAQYRDTTYGELDPFVVEAGDNLPLPNNAGLVLNDQIPVATDPLYDGVSGKITPDKEGDAYLLRIGFKRFTTSNTGYGEITLDIGQSDPILIIPVNFPRGSGSNNTRSFVSTELIFSGNDFVNNGGQLFYESVRGDTSLYDIRYLISRVHKSRSS